MPGWNVLRSGLLAAGLLAYCVPSLPVAAADEPHDPQQIARLVTELGDSKYTVRESATSELMRIGLVAREQLEAAVASPDAEVRHRARRILSVALAVDFRRRLARFAADVEDRQKLSLPGWPACRRRLGSSPAARALFVEMVGVEPELLASYDDGAEEVGRVLATRSGELQRQLSSRSGQPKTEVALGSVAALLLVVSDPDVQVNNQAGGQVYSLVVRAPFQAALRDEHQKPLLRGMLGGWVGRDEGGSSVDYQRVMLAIRHELPEGLPTALRIVRQPGTHATYRMYSLLAIGKLGSAKEIDALRPLLAEKTVVSQRKVDKRQIEVQLRDVALGVMVHLSGQELSSYGFKNVQRNTQYVFSPQSLYFEDAKAREVALAQWEKWAAQPDPKP